MTLQSTQVARVAHSGAFSCSPPTPARARVTDNRETRHYAPPVPLALGWQVSTNLVHPWLVVMLQGRDRVHSTGGCPVAQAQLRVLPRPHGLRVTRDRSGSLDPKFQNG